MHTKCVNRELQYRMHSAYCIRYFYKITNSERKFFVCFQIKNLNQQKSSLQKQNKHFSE